MRVAKYFMVVNVIGFEMKLIKKLRYMMLYLLMGVNIIVHV